MFIGGLLAIFLLEGDFNWFLKLTFSKQMIDLMHNYDMILVEHLATRSC